MIILRQKNFIAQFVPMATKIGSTLSKMGGGSKIAGGLNAASQASMIAGVPLQMKQMEDANRQTELNVNAQNQANAAANNAAKAEIKKAEAMNNIAKQMGKNNQNSQIAGQAVMKSFSITSKLKPAVTFAKDLWTVGNKNGRIKKRVYEGLAAGTVMAGLGYGINKAVTYDAKKNGMIPEQTEEEKRAAKEEGRKTLKKAAIGTLGAVGSAAAAYAGAKHGLLGKNLKSLATKDNVLKGVRSVGNGLKEGFKGELGSPGKLLVTGVLTTALSPAIPYAINKYQKSKQEDATKEAIEKTYSSFGQMISKNNTAGKYLRKGVASVLTGARKSKAGVVNFAGKAKNGVVEFAKAPVNKTLSGLSKYLYMTGGNKGVSNFTKELAEQGKKSGSAATQKTAEFLGKHKNLALVGSIGVGTALFKPWEYGEKATKKIIGAVDSDAYSYDKYTNKEVEQ